MDHVALLTVFRPSIENRRRLHRSQRRPDYKRWGLIPFRNRPLSGAEFTKSRIRIWTQRALASETEHTAFKPCSIGLSLWSLCILRLGSV